MFKRFTTEERDKLRNGCYYSDQLFVTHVDVLNDIQLKYDDLSPEEIWNEARMYARKLGKVKRPDKEVGSIYNEMIQKYAVFKKGTTEIQRGMMASERTAACVLLCVLYMLCTTEGDDNPNDNICKAIGKKIKGHPIVREIYEQQRKAEQEEEDAGRIVPFKDYFHEEENVEMEIMEKRERLEIIKNGMQQKLLGAFTSLNISKEDFLAMIDEITSIEGFMDDMEDIEYSGYTDFNRTLFCNLVGAMKRGGITDLSYDKLDEGLAFGVHVKNYINGNDVSKFSKHWKRHKEKIESIVKKYREGAL